MEEGGPEQAAMAAAELATIPKIEERFWFFWMAYQRLGTNRPSSKSEVPASIPLDSIYRFADRYNLSAIECEELVCVILEVDAHERTTISNRVAAAHRKAGK